MSPSFTKNKQILIPKMGPEIVRNDEGGAQANPAGAILESLESNMPPRWPRVAQDSPKLAQSRSQEPPKWSKMVQTAQDSPTFAQT